MRIEKDVLTTGDVARLCHVTIRTVIKWYEQGRLPGYRLPGSRDRRFTRDAVERFLVDNEIPVVTLPDARARRVLVVDDDEPVRTLIERYLQSLQRFEVRTAASGWEAGLTTASFRPHLLILDYRLGDVTGEQVVGTIRRHVDGSQPSILIISAHLTPTDVERVLSAGADGFLAKPFALDQLREAVFRHTELRA